MHRSRIDGNQALPPENRHLDRRARGRFPPLRPSTPSTSRFGSFIAPVIRFELHLPSPSRSSSVSPQRTEATLSSLPPFLRLACQFERAPAARPQAPRQAPRAALVTGLEQPRGRRWRCAITPLCQSTGHQAPIILVLVSAPPALMTTFTASSIGSLKGTSIRSRPCS